MDAEVALWVCGGEGLGHNMRILALAQQAKEMGVKALICGRPDSGLNWPFPLCRTASAPHNIVDGKMDLTETAAVAISGYTWFIMDRTAMVSEIGYDEGVGVIIPHDFVFEELPACKALLGSSFYPLRAQFASGPCVGIRGRRPLGYRLPERYKGEYRDLADENLVVGDMIYFMGSAPKFICPPSVVAYECLALGTPIMLHDEVDPEHAAITDALVAKGWATRVIPKPGDKTVVRMSGSKHIDGLGAARILEAILL